jgi:hypothetical protein
MYTNFTNLAYLESAGLAKCFEFYGLYFAGYDIESIGFNPQSGYVYIHLMDYETCIVSLLGSDAQIMITDIETGNETFFNSYTDYLNN